MRDFLVYSHGSTPRFIRVERRRGVLLSVLKRHQEKIRDMRLFKGLFQRVDQVLTGRRPVDDELFDELEEALIRAM